MRKFGHRRVWLAIAVLLVASILSTSFFLPQRGSVWNIEFHPYWQILPYHTVQSDKEVDPARRILSVFVKRTDGLQIGPVDLFREVSFFPQPVGTDQVHKGDILYEPDGMEFGRVLKLAASHKFPDGTAKPGMLIRYPWERTEWVPQEKVRNLLIRK